MFHSIRLFIAAIPLIAACSSPATSNDPQVEAEPDCAEASAEHGALVCIAGAHTMAEWKSVAAPLAAIDQVRAAKYLVPAESDARLPPLLLNSNRFEFHYDFMVEAFPERFAGLTPPDYLDLLFDAKRQEFFAGTVVELASESASPQFAFTLASDPSAQEFPACASIKKVTEELARRLPLAPNTDLVALPASAAERAWLSKCKVPVHDPGSAVTYEAYHRGVGIGTLRRHDRASLPKAVADVAFGFKDILVLDEAPSDLERVVAGAISGTRQGPLSHLAVRSASRGTPNCYVHNAYSLLEKWEGELVRIECTAATLLVTPATQADAVAFWQKLRPEPVAIPAPDREYTEMPSLAELAVSTPRERALAIQRFGAKAMNLAWLRQNMDRELTPNGFALPMRAYLDFVENEPWQVDLGTGKKSQSFAETLRHWLSETAFLSDARLRRERLAALIEAFDDAPCTHVDLETIGSKILSVFGSDREMLRFRSSSNAEDGALFNGAGLYDSFSGCLADDLDADDLGPSHCDSNKDKEKTVCEALKKTWASLWNMKAFEERDFYGIDQTDVTMGILVNQRSEGELANMVAFTGNPVQRSDARYLINAQTGELPVVSSDAGIWPEQVLLAIDDGKVSAIERVSASSESAEGEPVLSDATLRVLGAHLATLAAHYPLDHEPPRGRAFILDTEWKVMPDKSLRIKQVRPFLN